MVSGTHRLALMADPLALAALFTGALALSAAYLWGGLVAALPVAVLIWLIPLALHDVRHRSVPHMAWIAGPCLLAMVWAAWRGEWPLAGLALIVVGLSERQRLPHSWQKPAVMGGLIVCAALFRQLAPEAWPGAFAILGFWLGFELGWWAGADALAAITLALLWPDLQLLIALSISHLGLALLLRARSRALWGRPRALRPGELETLGQPGLPALALSAVVYITLKWIGA